MNVFEHFVSNNYDHEIDDGRFLVDPCVFRQFNNKICQ